MPPDDTHSGADHTPASHPHGPDRTPPGSATLHSDPRHLRIGQTGVFAGDWSGYTPDGGTWRAPIGFVGTLIDRWNGFAVFACTREVAEAIVTEQQRLREAERLRLQADGLDDDELTARLDELLAPMSWDDDQIVVDERAVHGAEGLSRITPDEQGKYVVNGWCWTWEAVDPADCDRIAGQAHR